MAAPTTTDVWRWDSTKASLQISCLSAGVDLLKPRAGLGEVVYNDDPIIGNVLGVNPGTSAALSERDLSDVFVRGSDLIVTYAETNERPFSLQIYWRATVSEQGAVLLDAILSLQTDLLESFPGIAVETKLPAAAILLLPDDAAAMVRVLADGEQHDLQAEGMDSLLLRPIHESWSYAEATHPEDRGESQIDRSQDDMISIQRQLGGRFLEKGVIRRLRVRGVFLPRENDLELAAHYLASLTTEQPPLTA